MQQAAIAEIDDPRMRLVEDGAERSAQSVEFLAFTLGSEEYGIDIRKVQEIRRFESVTHIANAPEYVKGVMNLRGHIVPVLDMRIKLNLGKPRYDQFTAVIILGVGGRVVGIVVDSVSDVTTLSAQQIKQPPTFGTLFESSYLIGIGSIEDRLVILVDIEMLMADDTAYLANATGPTI